MTRYHARLRHEIARRMPLPKYDLCIFRIESKYVVRYSLMNGGISFGWQVKFISYVHHLKNLAVEDISSPLASYGNVDAVNMATEYLIGVGRQIAIVMCSPVKTDATVGLATRTRRVTISKNVVIRGFTIRGSIIC